jgi:hypothetical protein
MLLVLGRAPSAQAWDAATTHAGLTEQAIYASTLGRILTQTLHRPLGLYEPLRINLTGPRGERLGTALGRLGSADGYAPEGGRLPALEWVVAGSVIEETPVVRMRNHFYDPRTQGGLDQGGFLSGMDLRMGRLLEGSGSVREFLTGGGLDGTGRPSLAWLTATDNDLGLSWFYEARERAVTAATPRERDAALAEALLVAGAILHVVEDATEPALVRNDFREEFARYGGPFRRWVAQRYGRLGVPAPSAGPIDVAHLSEIITNEDETGLADRTAAHFFSLGSLPGSTPTRSPDVKPGAGLSGYVAGEDVAHLAAWRREAGRLIWQLDERCYRDYASVLLPLAAHGALSALEHLFRGGLSLSDGKVYAGTEALGAGRLSFYAEDGMGRRRMIGSSEVSGAAAEDVLADEPTVEGARRLVAVFRGVDVEGEPIVVSAERHLE